jgi:hypothetical protein
MIYRLIDIAEVIRSKNSGPYELTLDVIMRERDIYERICRKKVFTAEAVAALYRVNPEKVLGIVEFEPAKAIKINLLRPAASGSLGETDVYGAQQHAPLLEMQFEL